MTQETRSTLLEPSSCESDCGELVGRDPKTVDPVLLHDLGFSQPMKAIRRKCLDCTGEVPSEVRKCTETNCPLWHLRMGKNLLRGANLS